MNRAEGSTRPKPTLRASHLNLLIHGGLPRKGLVVRKVDHK